MLDGEGGGKDVPKAAAKELRHRFEGMMHALHEQKGATLSISILEDGRVQDFVETHAGTLDAAFGETPMSESMRRALTRSDYVFSGMKAFHEMKEAFPSLLDEKGDRKPFHRFLRDVQAVDETYNRHYLRAEYGFVTAAADMAAKWERIEKDGDTYLLQYRTAGDANVRPEHAALDGITLPPPTRSGIPTTRRTGSGADVTRYKCGGGPPPRRTGTKRWNAGRKHSGRTSEAFSGSTRGKRGRPSRITTPTP